MSGRCCFLGGNHRLWILFCFLLFFSPTWKTVADVRDSCTVKTKLGMMHSLSRGAVSGGAMVNHPWHLAGKEKTFYASAFFSRKAWRLVLLVSLYVTLSLSTVLLLGPWIRWKLSLRDPGLLLPPWPLCLSEQLSVGLRGSRLDAIPEGAPNRVERSVSTSFQDTLVAAPGAYTKPHQRPHIAPLGNLRPQPGNGAQAVWVKGPGAGRGLQTQGCAHIHTKEAGKWQEEAVRHRGLSGTLPRLPSSRTDPHSNLERSAASSVASNETPPASRWVWAGPGRQQSAHLQGTREWDFSLAGVRVLSVWQGL